jgi:UDP-N-acetylmuramoylalanine-D-glutamate ligase
MKQTQTALIVGMAKSGVGAAKLLAGDGWRVIVNDKKPEIAGLTDALSGVSQWNTGSARTPRAARWREPDGDQPDHSDDGAVHRGGKKARRRGRQ